MRKYTIQHQGKFYTVNGQSAVTLGARFLRAVRVHFTELPCGYVIVQNHDTGELVTVSSSPF